jgi:hypothetical protein
MIPSFHTSKVLIIIGLLIAAAGVLFLLSGKFPSIGKLPGDIVIKRDHFTLYVPLGTCLIISLLLTLLLKFLAKR